MMKTIEQIDVEIENCHLKIQLAVVQSTILKQQHDDASAKLKTLMQERSGFSEDHLSSPDVDLYGSITNK